MDLLITIPMKLARPAVIGQLTCCQVPVAWHYMTARRPTQFVERLHFVHAGDLIGSLPIVDVRPNSGTLRLTRADGTHFRTAREWAILACGDFVPQRPPLVGRFKGFRGWRYWDGRCPDCSGLGNLEHGQCDLCDGTGSVATNKLQAAFERRSG